MVYDTYFAKNGYSSKYIYSYRNPVSKNPALDGVEAINQGCRFFNYNGHGLITRLNYGIGNNDLGKFTNTFYPYMLICACLTGTFDEDGYRCMGRLYVANIRGAAAYIGSFESSSQGQHTLNWGLYEAIMTKNITKYGLSFVYAVNSEKGGPYINKYFTNDTLQTTDLYNPLMGWQYHYFGDPAIETMAMSTPVVSTQKNTASMASLRIVTNKNAVTFFWTGNNNSRAKLKIYSLSGKIVLNQSIRTGVHTYSWIEGARSSGMFMTALTVRNGSGEKQTVFKKIIIMR